MPENSSYIPTREDIQNEEKDLVYWDKKDNYAKTYRSLQTEILSLTRNITLQEKTLLGLQVDKLKNSGDAAKELQKNITAREMVIAKSRADLAYSKIRLDHAKEYLTLSDKLKLSQLALSNFDYSKMLKSFTDRMYWGELIEETVGKIGVELTIAGKIAISVLKTFLKWDSVVTSFRISMGMFRKESDVLARTIQNITTESRQLGVNVETVIGSFTALATLQGGIWNVSKDLVKTLSLLSTSLGVSATTSTRVLRNFAVLTGSTMATQKNALLFAKALSTAGGVSFGDIANDLAGMSEAAVFLGSRLPSVLAKTAVELRRMGTDLNSAAMGSRHILDFTESMNEEMNASVLLGRSVNLQKARELAYHRDLEGSTKEILRQTQMVGFATRLDVFQQDAFAKATGRSVDELLNMLQADKEIVNARRSQNETTREMALQYDKLRSANEAVRKASADDVTQKMMSLNNQERLTAITDKWHKILSVAAYYTFPLIDNVLGAIVWGFNSIAAATGTWLLFGKSIGKFLGESKVWASWMKSGAEWLKKIGTSLKFGPGMAKWFKEITSFGKIGNLFKGFPGLLGKIGGAIRGIASKLAVFLIPITFAWHMFTRIRDLLKDPVLMGTKGFFAFNGKLILRALGVVFGGLWDVVNDFTFGLAQKIVDGFVWAGKGIWNAIKGWSIAIWSGLKDFIGFSPSVLGLSIVRGITSVGPMIFDALTAPFKSFMSWIGKLPVIGPAFSSMVGTNNVQSKATAAYVPAVTVTPTGTKIETGGAAGATANSSASTSASSGKTLDDIYNMLKTLNDNLTAGKIGTSVNIDGQLLSATLARQSDFRRGYGVNTIS